MTTKGKNKLITYLFHDVEKEKECFVMLQRETMFTKIKGKWNSAKIRAPKPIANSTSSNL
jgi:hypothetical protein